MAPFFISTPRLFRAVKHGNFLRPEKNNSVIDYHVRAYVYEQA